MTVAGLPEARRVRVRVAVGVALGIAIVGGLVAAKLGLTGAASWADSVAQTSRESGPLGWFLFGLAQTGVALIGIVPASLLGIAAGIVFGIGPGFAIAASGTLLGSWLAFWLARSLLRPWITRILTARPGGRLAGLDEAVRRDGWRLVCLLRVSPVMPFAITSYALGLTRIRKTDYVLGTLAALPALAGYVALGAMAGEGLHSVADVSAPGGSLRLVLFGIGGLATVALALRSRTLLSACGFLPKRVSGGRLSNSP